MKLFTIIVLMAGVFSVVGWGVVGSQSADPAGARPDNLQLLGQNLYSGATPGSAQLRWLKNAEITTVVSVDGAAPLVEEARALGLRYVHLPIGYDSVPAAAQAALRELRAQEDGPIYLHCHHGMHRGPAATAVLGIVSGSVEKEEALRFMQRAGTGKDYAGLWNSVLSFEKVSAEVKAMPLVEIAEVNDLAGRMVEIDRTHDYLQGFLATPRIQSSEALTEEARHQSRLLLEHFKESRRFLEAAGTGEALSSEFDHSISLARSLESALEENNHQRTLTAMSQLSASCKDCHQNHRN